MSTNLSPQYDLWNKKKKSLHLNDAFQNIYFKEGDIWWCSVGLNVGGESFGKGNDFRRPILIVKKLSSDLCIALPLTSHEKVGSWFIDIPFLNAKSWVMLYQIRIFHKKRFQYKMGKIDIKNFIRVKEKLKLLLESSLNYHPAEAGIEGITPQSDISISECGFESIYCHICIENETIINEYNSTTEFP